MVMRYDLLPSDRSPPPPLQFWTIEAHDFGERRSCGQFGFKSLVVNVDLIDFKWTRNPAPKNGSALHPGFAAVRFTEFEEKKKCLSQLGAFLHMDLLLNLSILATFHGPCEREKMFLKLATFCGELRSFCG